MKKENDDLIPIIINEINKLNDINRDQSLTLKEHEFYLKNITEKLSEYNKLLEEHIEGVEQNRSQIKENTEVLKEHLKNEYEMVKSLSQKIECQEKIIEKVDTWLKVWRFAKKSIITIGSIAAAVAAVYGAYQLFF